MSLPRRQLLKLTSMLSLGIPALPLYAANPQYKSGATSYIEVKNQQAAPKLKNGDYVLVDSDITTFSKDGIYLYPSWGKPAPYHVLKNNTGALEFYYPGKNIKLWESHLQTKEAIFSGKAIGFINGQQKQTVISEFDELSVPKLPLRV